jgi:hypothetical protein
MISTAEKRRYSQITKLFLVLIFMNMMIIQETVAAVIIYDLDEGIQAAVKKLAQKLPENSKIAVIGFIEQNSRKRWKLSEEIEDELITNLNEAGFNILERDLIDTALRKEMNHSAEFLFDEKQFPEIGKLIGADIVVSGKYRKYGAGDKIKIKIRAIEVVHGRVKSTAKVIIDSRYLSELLIPIGKKASISRTKIQNKGQLEKSKYELTKNRALKKQGVFMFESHNYPGNFIQHSFARGKISKIIFDIDKRNSTFKVVEGLAKTCRSFESINFPGFYLRHHLFKIKLHKYKDNKQFHQDATFCFKDGLADSSKVSFESLNYPGYYIRHRFFKLFVEKGNGKLFKKDATFTQLPATQ